MFSFKRFLILIVTALFAVFSVTGQSSGREMTVEESYLAESVELMIIRETSRASSLDQKMVALEYIGEAIGRGNTRPEIREALEFLSLEGTINMTREDGRVINNFPTVRRQAAKYLGQLGTEEAKNALIKICFADMEPMVLQEAVKSLGDIGIDNEGETTETIAWIARRFDVLHPDNLLALSVIDALDKLAKKGGGIKDPNVIQVLFRITDGAYIKPVQDRARQLLVDLRGYK